APARRHCRGASGTGRELEAARLNRLLAGYGRRPLPGLGDGRSSDTGDVPRRAAPREKPPLSILSPRPPPLPVRAPGGRPATSGWGRTAPAIHPFSRTAAISCTRRRWGAGEVSTSTTLARSTPIKAPDCSSEGNGTPSTLF